MSFQPTIESHGVIFQLLFDKMFESGGDGTSHLICKDFDVKEVFNLFIEWSKLHITDFEKYYEVDYENFVVYDNEEHISFSKPEEEISMDTRCLDSDFTVCY